MAIPEISRAATAGLAACVVTLLLTPVVRSTAVRFGWVSRPVGNRWGHRVVARLGGVAMFASFAGVTLWLMPTQRPVPALLVGAALVFGLGLWDDIRRMPPYTKLVGQLLIGCVMVISGIRISAGPWEWLGIPFSILWFVFVMNAFNLLDNMDGLAAGTGAIAATFCALHAGWAGDWVIATLACTLAGASLGMLHYNFPPAKIFMGDSGSHLLGLSLAALALLGSRSHSTQILSVLAVPTLVLALPIFDTCFVTIQRLLHGQHPFIGGQDHVSHRLAVLGLSVRQTVLALYVVSALLGLLGIISATLRPLTMSAIWLSVVTVLVLFGCYLAKVNVYRFERRPEHSPATAVDSAKPATHIETMLLHKRRLVEVLVDFFLVSSVYVFAHLLRFEGALTHDLQQLVVKSLPIILVIKIGCFAMCGLYRGMWRYVGLSDIIVLFRSVTLASMLSSLVLLFLWRFEGFSRSVFVIDWSLGVLAIGGSRVIERLLDQWIGNLASRGDPVVIIGAGDTGERVFRYLRYEVKASHVIGFLDDDPRKIGNKIHGTVVLGNRSELPTLLIKSKVKEVLIAVNDPPGELLAYVQRCCEPVGVTWKVVTAGVMIAS